MADVESVTNQIQNIMCHYKENQNRIVINALNDIRTCDGGHLTKTQAVKDKIIWCRRMTCFYKINLAFFAILLIFATCGMCLLRRYNNSNIYGGCSKSFLWLLDECPVAY